MKPTVSIKDKVVERKIGSGEPCFIIAEIGINHNGDIDLAQETIAAAAAAGVDAVKFQNYRTEDFVHDPELTYRYSYGGKVVVETQFDMFKRYELTERQLGLLKRCADDFNLLFLSTPTGRDGVDELVRLGVGILKNGSDYLGHLPLIEYMANSGLPVIVSTGMGTMEEITDAANAFRSGGGESLILLHCTSLYPTPAEHVNLRRMAALMHAFDCPVGFSDHTDGELAAVSAVAMGASVVEKHFTLNRSLPGPDHRFSADPDIMARLVRSVRYAETARGDGTFDLSVQERISKQDFGLSCVAARALEEGHTISDVDITFSRPGHGLAPKVAPTLLGKRVARGLAKGALILREDLDG